MKLFELYTSQGALGLLLWAAFVGLMITSVILASTKSKTAGYIGFAVAWLFGAFLLMLTARNLIASSSGGPGLAAAQMQTMNLVAFSVFLRTLLTVRFFGLLALALVSWNKKTISAETLACLVLLVLAVATAWAHRGAEMLFSPAPVTLQPYTQGY